MTRATLREFVELEGRTHEGPIFDLTIGVSLLQLLRSSERRVQPFVAGGFSVHAMSSSFHSTVLDQRYNTNNFGAHAALGIRLRLGAAGGSALGLELRRTSVRQMNRTSLAVSLQRLTRALAEPLGREGVRIRSR
ncbi:MAG: hypothetical protein ACT4R6_09100 [Gemmatimonadaceae bacterium]